MSDTNYRYLNWQDIEDSCYNIYSKMLQDNYKPDCIIGLLRGGIIPARIFSDYFNVVLDFFAMDVKIYSGIGLRNEEAIIRRFEEDIKGKSCLVVDDIADSGKTMTAVVDYLKGEKITIATLFWKEKSEIKPDYYSKVVEDNTWQIFPWEKYEFSRELNIT